MVISCRYMTIKFKDVLSEIITYFIFWAITFSDGFSDFSEKYSDFLYIIPKKNQKENLRGCAEQPILASGWGCAVYGYRYNHLDKFPWLWLYNN